MWKTLLMAVVCLMTSGLLNSIHAKTPVKVACVGNSVTFGYLLPNRETERAIQLNFSNCWVWATKCGISGEVEQHCFGMAIVRMTKRRNTKRPCSSQGTKSSSIWD